ERLRQEEAIGQQEAERIRQEEERKRQELTRLQEEKRFRKAQEEEKKRRTLVKGTFRLYLDHQNRIHMYYDGNEFTKGPGLHAGIFSDGAWYSSSDSDAAIKRLSPDTLSIHFVHNRLPLTQIWRLSLGAKGILTWNVSLDLKEPLSIDKRNISLFLSKVYRRWMTDSAQGSFPLDFGVEWRSIYSSRSTMKFTGASSDHRNFPGIIFKDARGRKTYPLINNSDLQLSSRVLEFQSEEEQDLHQPGTHPCFKVVIQLYPGKNALENAFKKIVSRKKKG
ncbi:hypothetical protein ACFL5X_03330, partial [Candidatus Omnitrophota bacterium]